MAFGDLPRNRVCGICGGVMTMAAWPDMCHPEQGRKSAYACIRCDTDAYGKGYGPPRFVAIWNERTRDAWSAWGKDERGSE